ncbi:MAG TPA: type II toxin-antitoxin system VapC family toxin [Candidatus Saccharimonadales bacterium]|jgi:predicted nucleic acid-binding protein|nr:type II toxin-antitoxin system VapC family toxin [Candidatus Saccharimonadales bacterium]
MRILVDTNILLRAAQRSHPAGRVAINAIKALHRQQNVLCLAPQNLIEFWNVCTRPVDVNGLGLSVAGTDRYVKKLKILFTIIHDSPQTFEKWHALVLQYNVIGSKVHDARLAAVMRTYGITSVLTFNVKDFNRYGGITAIDPNTVS